MVAASSCTHGLRYPATKKTDVKDTVFGTVVDDPYRWLEDDNSPETAEWVSAQNAVTFDYLNSLANRDAIRNRLTELIDYARVGLPFRKADKYFQFRNDGLQNQSVLYYSDAIDGDWEPALDPNTLADDGTVALSGITISDDARYLVYMIARSGSDWNEILVKDLKTGNTLDDHIKWVKFSGLSWYDGGFYYSAYDKPADGAELTVASEYQKVFYHKLGDAQANDVVVLQEPNAPKRMFQASVTEDRRFLAFSLSEGTTGNGLTVVDLKSGKNIPLAPISEHDFYLIENLDDNLYILTNCNAPRYRLVRINAARPDEQNWTDILPEQSDVLQGVHFAKGKIVATYMHDAHSIVKVYDYDGTFDHDITLPGIGDISGISGKKEDAELFYGYTSFNTPGEIVRYNVETRSGSLYFRPTVKFNPDDYIVKQEFYVSKDGTKVPVFIVHRKDLTLNGANPALLYGYGGFNISLTPSFSASRIVFLEKGGVLAVANLRGGGEYGDTWHKAGIKMNKQNVFDDFIAAAEYLIAQKYTVAGKLAIQGGSNGGLLIGAVVNQRPDLFKVAIPQVGVMDMLRYQKFTIGWAWADDYGSADDSKEMFEYLYGYSPYHNIRHGGSYPATLITTADHDDRVVPAHSFKYAARLQEYNRGELPTLIRIDVKAGHGGGKPTAKIIDESTDIWAFIFHHLEV
jgi:prolyl oligopeptidase